tara:strand:+ start:4754 stop:5947 length:1194 start_codon:yes stop_codon:yes gene_type:complete
MIRKNKSNENNHDPVIGIVGGGQLSKMLVEAAHRRNIKTFVQTNSAKDPAGLISDDLILADSHDPLGTKQLAEKCNGIIFENEWIEDKELIGIEKEVSCFFPKLSALSILVNKITQRKLLDSLNIPSPKWITIKDFLNLEDHEKHHWQFPLMAKASRGGYDGKGTKKINSISELENFFEQDLFKDWYLESWVDYDFELSIISSRDKNRVIRTFPLVKTSQKNQICNWVLAPANIDYDVEMFAQNIINSIMTQLDYVGVMAVEFFFGRQGLIVNEVAPRTHNSAHFSIDACNTSQFDQNVCIAADINVPDINLKCNGALMVNLLGLEDNDSFPLKDRLEKLSSLSGSHLHWYEKAEEKGARKMGHITFLFEEGSLREMEEKAIDKVNLVHQIWPFPQS